MLLAHLLSAALVPQTTWTVDDDGGADFTDLAPAIAAAADGDVVLVRPGSHAQFVLAGKGLSIVGGGAVHVGGPGAEVRVENVPRGSRVLLANLDLTAPAAIGVGSRLRIAGASTRATLIDVAALGVELASPLFAGALDAAGEFHGQLSLAAFPLHRAIRLQALIVGNGQLRLSNPLAFALH